MIHTRALGFAYPGAPPLQFPDLQAPQGALVLLSGPSGSGKSTWLALVRTLRHAAADAWRARAIGFLPQKLHLSAALTVEQNLAMAQWAAGQAHDRSRILITLERLGVADLMARKPSQLSGGQAQRVALARAVLREPAVILADEPTASLDDASAHDALDLLLQTASTLQATLVIATHDQRVARLLAQGPRAADCLALQLAPALTAAHT